MTNYSVSYLAPFAGGGSPLLPGRSQDVFFVDGSHGSNDNNGKTIDRPLATITRAIELAEPTASVFNRSTVIFVAPGQCRERVVVNKPDIAIIGGSGRYPGRTRIVGDGATVAPTIYVAAPYLRGFTLANIFVETGYPDTTSVAAPAIYLVTDDTVGGDSTEVGANSQNYHFKLYNVRVIADGIPTCGLALDGASFGEVDNCTFSGCVNGVLLGGNEMNAPVEVNFSNCRFSNNVTMDVGTANMNNGVIVGAGEAQNGIDSVEFWQCRFLDVGGTPVTNYVNMAGTITNVAFNACYFNRAIADGTLTLIPAGVNIIGSYSPDGLESIVGA